MRFSEVPSWRWRRKGESDKMTPHMSDTQPSAEERQRGALLIAASLIAAIRLRGAPIDNSPKTVATIYDAVKLVGQAGFVRGS
jgi:hypothetical protein